VDGGAVLPANCEALELVEPREGALHDPTNHTESGTMADAPTGDDGPHAALFDQPSVLVVVVAAVSDNAAGPPARPAGLATHRWDRVQQRDELGDVIAVSAGQRDRERDPVAVDE
jgi:hypothetical protein